jgi:hypothetical protein
MKWIPESLDRVKTAAWFCGIAGALGIIGALAWLIVRQGLPPGIDEERAALRRTYLAETQAADREALATYGWVDPTKGIVRLPIERAMALALERGPDAAALRGLLLERNAAATAPPPEEENPYE